MTTTCAKCRKQMPKERAELGLDGCKGCTDAKPLFGFMVDGELCFTESRREYEQAMALPFLGMDDEKEGGMAKRRPKKHGRQLRSVWSREGKAACA